MWKTVNLKFRVLCILSYLAVTHSYIINKSVERSVDLSSHLVKESLIITAEDSANQPFSEYSFVLPKDVGSKLAFISIKDRAKTELQTQKIIKGDKIIFDVLLPSALTNILYIETIYSNTVQPHPEEIKQLDKQLILYSGNLHYFSHYPTTTQTTSVKLNSANIISYTQIKPFSVASNKIKYGPYEKVEEYSNTPLILHYENNSPFLTVRHLERILEVSHWGNIAVRESIVLEHTGAKLKGSFSRYEYQKDTRSGQSSVKSYKTILPASASDVYYRDSNGNISTSNMKILRDSVELELRPRFPLFGGWKTQYVLGYNVPSFEYLYNSNENFLLKMRVIDHIYDDMVIDEAVIKIILPEGTTNIELISPYSVNRVENDLFFTYLDTVGRPVISFSKSNLIENHIADFELKYNFSSTSLLAEPLLVIAFIFLIFVCTIIYLRLDFSIAYHNHKE